MDAVWIAVIVSIPIIIILWKLRYRVFVRTDTRGYKRVIGTGALAHRKIAEQGRQHPLGDLVVHHKDGDKRNNRRSNLQVMRRSTHSRLHARRRASSKRQRRNR